VKYLDSKTMYHMFMDYIWIICFTAMPWIFGFSTNLN
jgi:hypothetical protein